MQRYMGSLVGNSASGLAVAHVLVMRDRDPFPPTSPRPGSVVGWLKGTGSRLPAISGQGHIATTKFCLAVGIFIEGLIHANLVLCRNIMEALSPTFNHLSSHLHLLQL